MGEITSVTCSYGAKRSENFQSRDYHVSLTVTLHKGEDAAPVIDALMAACEERVNAKVGLSFGK